MSIDIHILRYTLSHRSGVVVERSPCMGELVLNFDPRSGQTEVVKAGSDRSTAKR